LTTGTALENGKRDPFKFSSIAALSNIHPAFYRAKAHTWNQYFTKYGRDYGCPQTSIVGSNLVSLLMSRRDRTPASIQTYLDAALPLVNSFGDAAFIVTARKRTKTPT
jgi:hypothetical protein